MILAVDVPNPADVVPNPFGDAAGWAWDKVAEGITSWVLGAVGYFVEGVVGFLLTSARPDVEAVWFTGAGSPYATVRGIAAITLALFVLLGLIQGLLAGDVGGMVRRIVVDLPLAILGMISTTVVVGRLVELTDALSEAVLSNADGQAVHFLSGFGVTVNSATQGFAAVILGLAAVLAAFFVWVELMVRSVLIHVLVAVSPLSFAAMVWPATRGVLRRTIELLVAVILSKLVISIALAVGVAALSGAGPGAQEEAGVVDEAAMSLGTLLIGTAILGMAAFAPFVLLKLVPVAEAAVVAYGVSRSPVRAAQSTMSNAYYLSSVRRLAGGGSGGAGGNGSGSSAGGGSGHAVAVTRLAGRDGDSKPMVGGTGSNAAVSGASVSGASVSGASVSGTSVSNASGSGAADNGTAGRGTGRRNAGPRAGDDQ